MRSLVPIFVLLAGGAASSVAATDAGLRDPEFARVPFAEWRSGAGQTRMGWSVELTPAVLSVHQRMLLRAVIHIQGHKTEPGRLILFIEYLDAAGHVWQQHVPIDPARPGPEPQAGFERGSAAINHYAFLLPGDYSIAFGLWDSASGKHALIVRKAHIAAINRDPLPNAWAGLPSVEFITAGDIGSHDVWFLPGVAGVLNLPVTTRRPVHVEVLLNATPSKRSAGVMMALRENMSLLIPAVKAFSGLRLSDGAVDVSMLDLTRRRTVFSQLDVRALDWGRLQRFFAENNPGLVDVQSLAAEGKMRGYFLGEIERRMMVSDGQAHVVVVLSGPALMDHQEPWEHAPPALDADHRLIYIRYRSDPAL
ncbi:MAG: hypothetical protein ABJC09_10320, partial [Terriglobia bacterium]